MIPARRAASAAGVLAILLSTALYLPSPISAVAGAVLALFVLLLALPLILTAIGVVSAFLSLSDDEGGLFEGILDAWFLWGALDLLWYALKWPWVVVRWAFTRRRPISATRDDGAGEPPFNSERR